jgi:hypothetical protein
MRTLSMDHSDTHVHKIVDKIFGYAQLIEHQRRLSRDVDTGSISTLFDVLARFRHTKATRHDIRGSCATVGSRNF